jgi:PKD repeat protein
MLHPLSTPRPLRRAWRIVAAAGMCAITLSGIVACGSDGPATIRPNQALEEPVGLAVEAVGSTSIRLSWARSQNPDVIGYLLERRANLEGPYQKLVDNIPNQGQQIVYFDNSTQADTYYGYRVYAVTSLGTRSPASVVGGAKTPPPPTLIVRTVTSAPTTAAADPDGYVVTILGPRDTLSSPVPTSGEKRFAGLRGGQYLVLLRGLANNCDFASGDSTRAATVTETGTKTEVLVDYAVSCRDRQKGSIVIRYEQRGDTTDPNGVRVNISGLLTEPDPVDTARVYFNTRQIGNRNETVRYDNLRRGNYEVTLDDLASVCTLEGTRRRTLQVRALSIDTVAYVTTCTRPVVVDTAGKPFVLESRWSQSSAPNGSKVSLTVTYDASADANANVAGVQANLAYSAQVLRYDSARTVDFDIFPANGRNPGVVSYAATNADGSARNGRVTVGRIWFTVIGATGASTRTSTSVVSVPTTSASDLKDRTRVTEATLTVGTAVGTTNQPPTARANGPYTGRAGAPIQFSAAGSTDSDGSIVSYNWAFGDGTSSNLDGPSKIYPNAGTYTATLTVTDDRGATGTATAVVTVSPATGGGTNQAPVARISAPVSAALNAQVSLSGSSSTDADGTIASYAWNFGDGTTASGQTVTKSWATPGTFTVVLTVTDDKGASGVAQHTITVGGSGGGTSIVWSSAFGSIDPVSKEVILTVTLDLTPDLAETPGPEQLASYIVDSLKWDPVVLQMTAFNFGPGQAQGIDQTDVARGKLRFNGSTLPNQNTGVLTIARIRFKVLGGTGARTTTVSTIGPLVGTPATGSFNYRPRTEVREGTLVVP